MFGSAILEVAIGLIFIYLILALVCTAVNEWIAQALRLRAKTLAKGIERLFQDATFTRRFYEHPLIRSLASSDKRRPAYIPARRFALAVTDLIRDGQARTEDALVALRQGLGAREPNDPLRKSLDAVLLTGVNEIASIEQWFEQSMERVSGWYKRRSQIITVVVAFLVTIAANADTLAMATKLWRSPTLRATVVEQARQRAGAERPREPWEYTEADAVTASHDRDEDAGQDTALISAAERDTLGQIISWNDDLNQLSVMRREGNNVFGWIWWLLLQHGTGWLLTGAAVALGAPFWFDTLNRFVNIRGAGKAPEEKPKTS